jgi:hypothetical protein
MKLVLQKRATKKKLLQELRNLVNELRMLFEPWSAPTYTPRPSRHVHGNHLQSQHKDRRQQMRAFDDFYDVLSKSFRCQCSVAHDANLRLSDSFEVVFPFEIDTQAISRETHAKEESSEFGIEGRQGSAIDDPKTLAPTGTTENDESR